MSPLCSDCLSEAETTPVRSRPSFEGQQDSKGKRRPTRNHCSRCGRTCDNCGSFTPSNTTAPVSGITMSEMLCDPELAFIAGMVAMGFVWLTVIFI